MKKIILLLLLASCFASIHLVIPKNIVIEDLQTVEINPVGPGQELFLKFERNVDNYVWDKLSVKNSVDSDWVTSFDSDHEYLYYSVLVPRSKESGEYTFEFEISDDQELVDSEIAVAKVFVTHNSDDLVELLPLDEEYEGFAGEEIFLPLRVNNKAFSRAEYKVSSSSPNYPSFKSVVSEVIPAGQVGVINIPVVFPDEGEYFVTSILTSDDNPTIKLQQSTRVFVKPTLQSKLKSIGQGFPLIPITMSPFYAVLGLFGW